MQVDMHTKIQTIENSEFSHHNSPEYKIHNFLYKCQTFLNFGKQV
jgi:hypothetical protein